MPLPYPYVDEKADVEEAISEIQQNFDALERRFPLGPEWLRTVVAGQKYSTSITGDGVAVAFTVTHNLGTDDVHVTVYANAAPKADVLPTVTRPSVNSVTVTFGAAPAVALVYRVVVSS